MRKGFLPICLLLLTGCGGRRINNGSAQDAIVRMPQEILQKEDVNVVSIQQISGSNAIVETKLKTAFRLEKIQGKWEVREVRVGNGQWVTVSNLFSALDEAKIRETQTMLDRIADAIHKYRAANGRFPEFKDYISLSDTLSPTYLTPLIRLDAWRKPFEAQHPDSDTILIISTGADGKSGTADDLRRIIGTMDK
jgi:hypothetical protein